MTARVGLLHSLFCAEPHRKKSSNKAQSLTQFPVPLQLSNLLRWPSPDRNGILLFWGSEQKIEWRAGNSSPKIFSSSQQPPTPFYLVNYFQNTIFMLQFLDYDHYFTNYRASSSKAICNSWRIFCIYGSRNAKSLRT